MESRTTDMKAENKFDCKKEELFRQITELISQYGYENITIRGLCREMGISTGTFYHYFHDKGDLIRVLFDDIDEYFATDVSERFTDSEPDNLTAFFVAYGKYVVRNGVESCRCISIGPLASRENRYLEESRGISTTLLGILKRGVEKKQFKENTDPEDMTRMLLILLRGYSADWAKRDGNYDIVKEMEKFGKFICEPLLEKKA